MKFCPICGDILYLVRHESPTIGVYWMWECPAQDWFEPTDPPEDGESYQTVVDAP